VALRGRHTQTLETRLAAIAQQLDGYEAKLAELSRAHAAAETARVGELEDLRRRMAELEAANAQRGETIRLLRRQRADRLSRLQRTIAGQREALSGLEQALESVDDAPGSDAPLADAGGTR
jgi:chromosome segregation ATPase